MDRRKIIIIGAGASGLLAAGTAASSGADVVVLEKMHRPGRKLRITGKGRCNLTNIADIPDFISHFGKNGKFLRQAFARFFSYDLIKLLTELNVVVQTERGGRVFPAGNDARQVVDALTEWVKSKGAVIKKKYPINEIIIKGHRAIGVSGKTDMLADAIIVATGGKSYPATGSTGDGYDFAASAGHTIVPLRPALVPIETKGNTAARLQGLSLKNISVSVYIDGRKKYSKFGEMIFTHYGVSGPIILSLSKYIVDALRDKKEIEISIDLKPALDEKKLDNRLLRDIKQGSKKHFQNMLKGLLPQKLISPFCELTNIDSDKTIQQITVEERKRLRTLLKDFRLKVSGHKSYDEAIVTAGGIALKEINPLTMKSRIISNLYFCGEILDLDGETGGYNLQAAFSTGYLAGISAASLATEK
ncbi:MAG: NAD(P)/FAD-dependent oxidoreductase [candidate division Zixibacteria bacterium]